MLIVSRKYTPLRHIIVPLAAGIIILSTVLRGPAQAEPSTYIISGNDGYGITDCLSDGIACGRTVADAWCKAHAKGPAQAFGLASDITGSTGSSPVSKSAPGDVIITCKD